MTPKEKAHELLDKMYSVKTMYDAHNITIHEAKQCTIIAIDEVLSSLYEIDNSYYWWQEVKQEIELL